MSESLACQVLMANAKLTFHIAQLENNIVPMWIKAKDKKRFLVARPGDSLCSPFQFDFCWFVNLQGRPAREGSPADERPLGGSIWT